MNKKKFPKSRSSSHQRTALSPAFADAMLTEKRTKTELKEAFLSSPKKKCSNILISSANPFGTIGKNLMNMEFPLEQESEGGTQHFLMKLRESKLTDDALVESFTIKSSKTMIIRRIITLS